jgi:site-specific recombinase XerD
MARLLEKKSRGVYEKEPGSGVWWIRYSDGKRIRREKVGRKSDAMKLYLKRKAQVIGGEKLPPPRNRGITISDLCTDAVDWFRARKKKSLRSFEQRIAVIDREIGYYAAEGLSPQDIDEWLTKHDGWSNATKNRYKSVLSKVYQLAVTRGKVKINVARLAEHWTETMHKIRYLRNEEEARLRAAILKLCPKHIQAFEIALHTGMRQGEQFSLRWDAIDFDRRTIYLAQTKTGHHREIPMNETVFNALNELRKDPPKDGGVFPSDRYTSSITHPRKWWGSVVTEAGIENLRWHDMRHTFISRLVMKGADLRTVQELSGHRELSMLTRYAHLAPEHNRRAVELLDPPKKKGKKSH